MDTLLKDIRYGIRSLVKQPAFTVVAVFSIALGIGVNTAIFSFINSALFRPLPFAEPDRLVRVWDGNAVSYPDFVAYRDDAKVFSGLAAYSQRPMSLVVNGQSERIFGEFVSGNYFDVLKTNPSLGRGFSAEEDRSAGTHPVVVISNALWRQRFNSDPGIIGKSVSLNRQPYTVIGVMPEKFVGATVISPPDLWVPLMMEPIANTGSQALTLPDSAWLMMLGRLRPDADVGAAQAAVETIAARLHQARRDRKSGSEQRSRTVAVLEARGLMVPPQGRTPALVVVGILMTVVSLVLLVACANVANMLLARAVKRRKEIAVRLALGAGRWRITRQMLTESVLLSVIGGGAGLLLALWGTDLLMAVLPQSLMGNSLPPDLTPDARVFGYTLLLSLATGVTFGLLPALQSSKPDVVAALKDERIRLVGARRGFTFRNLLVVTQVAVSMLLLVTSGLFIRNLRNTQHPDPGFAIDNGLMASFDLDAAGYDSARGRIFQQQLLERLRASAQVQSASFAESVPMRSGGSKSALYVEGEASSAVQLDESSLLNHTTVDTDYFKTLGIPLVRGRDFNDRDTTSSPAVVIVNETLARRLAPDGNAVGKRLRMDSKGDYLQVVGVARDIKYHLLTETPLFFAYRPLSQRSRSTLTLHVRTVGEPSSVISQIRSEVRDLDSDLPLTDIATMQEHMRLPLAPAKLLAWLSSGFAVLTLLLAAIGLYGVMAYLVGSRTHEIGIRMALGAQTGGVLKLIIAQGMRLALTGIALGLIAAFALTRVLASLLYGVSATDPLTFTGMAALLAGVAMLACYLPARRATKVDPLVALRYE
jgi:predicted permease